jgi:signal transduction histidine kinase
VSPPPAASEPTSDETTPPPEPDALAPALPEHAESHVPLEERPLVSRLRAGQLFGLGGVGLAIVLIACVTLGIIAIVNLTDTRHRVVDKLDPARVLTANLLNAYLDEETGMRGYALSGDRSFLEPYTTGVALERTTLPLLRARVESLDSPELSRRLDGVLERAEAWKADYVRPALAASRAGTDDAQARAATVLGKERFDELRTAFTALEDQIKELRADGRTDLSNAAGFLSAGFIAIVVLLLLTIAAGALLLRRIVTRPLQRLSAETRIVARGDYGHVVGGSGARDIVDLGEDIGLMRRRIVRELESLRQANALLDDQSEDLRRSNAELEQFAYVASHDLQEPLRKVASFTQLLQRRYGDQLDERADQYIDFAVDGAKRMQQLINDLLAFSRVGRVNVERGVVALDAVVRDALANLAGAIEEAGAVVQLPAEPLPEVHGEPALLGAVFQNLVGNAVKFRGEDPVVVRVSIERHDGEWEIAVADNGIGIDAEYAERIFVIFQRLHPKDAYAGTGIGLALCRKIVEYHGGRIWLDTSVASGTTFRFTLPVLEKTE